MENKELQILSEIKDLMATLRDQMELLETKIAQLQHVAGQEDEDMTPIDLDLDDIMVEPVDETKSKEYLDEYGNKMQDYSNRLSTVNASVQNDNYTILLSHRPEFFELYTKYDFDLVLCGHAHGGQWRIPGILNGLYAPHQGIFPKYAGGRYDSEDMTMIVSRGLARETTRVPRIFNRPELVVIDLE